MAKLSKRQNKALDMIDELKEEFGITWFVQAQLPGITKHTMDALVERGHLRTKCFAGVMYYRLISTVYME